MFEKDVFPKLVNEGKLYAYPKMKRWQDCGTFKRWQEAIENW
jgi:NDP-sugar pyrophosphorylase family protein